MVAENRARLRIAVVFDNRHDYLALGYSEHEYDDMAYDGESEAIVAALEELGHWVTRVPGIRALSSHLATHDGANWDLVFNRAEGFFESAREAQVPCLLEAYQIPHTFADAATLSLCLNKAHTKMVLIHNNIATAPFVVVAGHEESVDWAKLSQALPAYPIFVKPACQGSSKGLSKPSKAIDLDQVKAAVAPLRSQYPGQDILLESFLSGRELSVSIVGTGPESRVAGVAEYDWEHIREPGGTRTQGHCGFAPQWQVGLAETDVDQSAVSITMCRDLAHPQISAACALALKTWSTFNCRDAGRVDIRFDSAGSGARPYVLEVNPIAGLHPEVSVLPPTVKANGISYTQLMAEIVESCMAANPPEGLIGLAGRHKGRRVAAQLCRYV